MPLILHFIHNPLFSEKPGSNTFTLIYHVVINSIGVSKNFTKQF